MSAPLTFSIRPASMTDLDALVDFSAALARETEGRELDRQRLRAGTATLLTTPAHGRFVVAELAGGTDLEQAHTPLLIGQLMLTYEWSDWRNGQFWWIQSVYVEPTFRRRGVYRRLHEEVLRLATADGAVCGVRLYVERANHVAQSAYRRTGLHPAPYDVYEDDFILGAHHALPADTRDP